MPEAGMWKTYSEEDLKVRNHDPHSLERTAVNTVLDLISSFIFLSHNENNTVSPHKVVVGNK